MRHQTKNYFHYTYLRAHITKHYLHPKITKLLSNMHMNYLEIVQRTLSDKNPKRKFDFDIKTKPCESCSSGKGRQSNMPQTTNRKLSEAVECLYIDISSINTQTIGENEYWIMIVDDHTKMKWVIFIMGKSELPKIVYQFLKHLKGFNYNVKYI